MKNYIVLDGEKIEISEETANNFKEKFQKPKFRFKVGDHVRIVNEKYYHGFAIGQRVVIIEAENDVQLVYKARSINESYFVSEDEIDPII